MRHLDKEEKVQKSFMYKSYKDGELIYQKNKMIGVLLVPPLGATEMGVGIESQDIGEEKSWDHDSQEHRVGETRGERPIGLTERGVPQGQHKPYPQTLEPLRILVLLRKVIKADLE